jgi:DNA-binding beta-propeller fold protein YncE
MANTVIQIKSSGVVGNVPSTLFPGELAINYEDGKLYYGDSANQTVLFDAITEPAGLDGEIQFNNLGSFGSDGTLTFNDST